VINDLHSDMRTSLQKGVVHDLTTLPWAVQDHAAIVQGTLR
jgi:hypothetical protein